MKIGMLQPLVGLCANAPVNTPVFCRPSAWRSSSDFELANSRYDATASDGSLSRPKVPRHVNGELSGHSRGDDRVDERMLGREHHVGRAEQACRAAS